MSATEFITIPSDEQLRSVTAWSKSGDVYVAVRSHLMVIRSEGIGKKNGPPVSIIDVPAGSEITSDIKIRRSVKLAEEVSTSLESTISTKLNNEITAVLKSGSTAKLPTLEAAFQTELQSRVGLELTETLRETLSQMSRVEVETSVEESTTVKFTVKDATSVAWYMVLRPKHWDVYLVGAEAMILRWNRSWTLARVRETIRHTVDNTRRALFRLTLYEPQVATSAYPGEYTPETTETSLVEVEALDGKVPRRKIPVLPELQGLATDAFPTTIEFVKALVTRKKKPARRPAAGPSSSRSRKASSSKRKTAKTSRSSAKKSSKKR